MWWMWLVTAFAADTWARVAPEAPLFAHAGDATPVVAVPALEDYLFEVVAERGGWVGLRPNRDAAGACVPGHFPATRADITLWTPATSLLRVATRAAHAEP